MRTFIAGASSTRLSVASSSVLARSLAWPLRELGDQVGGGRRDDHEVGGARQLDMAHLGLVGQVEERAVDRVAGEGGDGERRDELGAAGGQDRRHRGAGLLQQADELEALVGGDAAADDQEYPAAGEHGPVRLGSAGADFMCRNLPVARRRSRLRSRGRARCRNASSSGVDFRARAWRCGADSGRSGGSGRGAWWRSPGPGARTRARSPARSTASSAISSTT